MATVSPANTDPLTGQFGGKRGKKLSWEKEGIVWDPMQQSLEIRKVKDIGKRILVLDLLGIFQRLDRKLC